MEIADSLSPQTKCDRSSARGQVKTAAKGERVSLQRPHIVFALHLVLCSICHLSTPHHPLVTLVSTGTPPDLHKTSSLLPVNLSSILPGISYTCGTPGARAAEPGNRVVWITLPSGLPGSQGPRGQNYRIPRHLSPRHHIPPPQSQEIHPGYTPVQPALTAHGMEGTARLLLETFAQFENPLTTVQVREPRRPIHSRPLPRARPRPPAVTTFPSSCTGRGCRPELRPLRARLSRSVRPPPGAPRVPIGCLETAAPPLACGPAPPLAPSPALSPLSRVATHAARRTGPR